MDPKELYGKLNEILDSVEELLSPLAKNLNQASIERWRWDEPVVTLSWLGNDCIGRNIHALVIEEAAYAPDPEVQVEVNAWQDDDREEGTLRVRKWQHKKINNASSNKRSDLSRTLSQAYEVVSRWTREDLRREYSLSDATRSTQR